ncbi:MAG: hypothetical protein IKZ87_02135 [Actinomycetaceae bacterium]|nr:hypothetical protein [Actinomycetaceae bacterium]
MSNTYVTQRASGQVNNPYEGLANTLDSYRVAIENDLNDTKYQINATSFESSFLKGQYYTTYCDKKNDWLDQHEKIIASFESFLADLDVCISNALKRANS